MGSPYEAEEKSDKYNTFAKVHKEMFKSEPNFVAIYSFEAAQVLFYGIEKSEKLNALMIKNAINRLYAQNFTKSNIISEAFIKHSSRV